MSIRSRRGGSGVEQGGDACVALVGIPELSSPAMMILSLSRITSVNSEKTRRANTILLILSPYGDVVL
jgi:ribosome-interacting GTPase 1